jgi:hypothetical protein
MAQVECGSRNAVEAPTERSAESALAGKLREFCVTWERAVKTICLYPSSNPLPDEFRQKFHDALTELLEACDGFALTVADTYLAHGDDRVYERSTTDDNLAYMLFRDGICRLEFKAGLRFGESCAFLNTLAEIYATPGAGGDVANSLWQQALSHIRHYALDRIVAGTYIEAADDEQIAERHKKFLATHLEADVAFGGEVRSDQAAATLYCGVQQERYGYLMEVFGEVPGLTEEERSELAAITCTNRDPDCERLGLGTLFEILRTNARPRLIEDTVAVIEGQFQRAVSANCWGMVKSILENWRVTAPETPPSVSRQIKSAQMRAADARHFECLTDYLNANPDCDLNEARGVLENFGSLALTLIVSMLGVLEHRDARLMICSFLAQNGREAIDLIGGFIHDKRWFVVRNVAKILGDIGNPRGAVFLQRSVNHSDHRVRLETLHALARLPGRTAQEALIAFIDDPAKKIRIRALRAIGSARVEAVGQQLANRIDHATLAGLAPDEMVELLRAYARTANTTAPQRLLELASRSPWFGRRRWLPVRVAAINALGVCSAPGIDEELAGLSKSRNREIAMAAQEALQRRSRVRGDGNDQPVHGKDSGHEADDSTGG